MTLHYKEKTFKRIGENIEQAFTRLNEGLTMVEMIDQSSDERERDIYTKLAAMQAHHTWHSLVKLFRRIALEVDNGVPKGPGAAQKLIEQMLVRTNDRPNILSMQHREMVQKLRLFHKDFRNVNRSQHSRSELVELIEYMNEELAPSVLENVRVLALSAPGGSKLVAQLRPKSHGSETVQYDDLKTA